MKYPISMILLGLCAFLILPSTICGQVKGLGKQKLAQPNAKKAKGKAFGHKRKEKGFKAKAQFQNDKIEVKFADPWVIITSTRDISNIVIEYYDGQRDKFDNLTGHKFKTQGKGDNAGKMILRVWVKAGPNFSGDGPGFGQRFERPKKKK